jgi:hypothetical protein
MIPAGLLRLVALRIQRSPRSRRGSLRAHSILHPVTSKTTVLLTCSVLRPHSRVPCAMPSNPGHVIDLCGYASRCIAMLTKHNHSVLYELFGGVINQACINYVTSILCSYASTRHTCRTWGLTRDDVRLDLTIAHLSQCPVTTPRLILHPPRIGNLRDTTDHEETTTLAH